MLKKLLVHLVGRLLTGSWPTPVLARDRYLRPAKVCLRRSHNLLVYPNRRRGFACDSCIGCEDKLERNYDGEERRIEITSSDRCVGPSVLKAGMLVSLLVCFVLNVTTKQRHGLKNFLEIPWPRYGPTRFHSLDAHRTLGREALTMLSYTEAPDQGRPGTVSRKSLTEGGSR